MRSEAASQSLTGVARKQSMHAFRNGHSTDLLSAVPRTAIIADSEACDVVRAIVSSARSLSLENQGCAPHESTTSTTLISEFDQQKGAEGAKANRLRRTARRASQRQGESARWRAVGQSAELSRGSPRSWTVITCLLLAISEGSRRYA